MAEHPITEGNVRREALLAAVLTNMVDTKEALPILSTNNENVTFLRDGKYISYADLPSLPAPKPNDKDQHPTILKPADLSNIRIKLNGADEETVYFRKITQAGGTNAEPGSLGTNTGFKAIAWEQTEADGTTPKRDQNGKKQVVLAFPGWVGHPYDGKPATASMYAAGAGELYPPTKDAKNFVLNVLYERGEDIAVTIDAHSMGTAPALAAAMMLERKGIEVKQLVAVDPVTASIFERRVREALKAKIDGTEKALPADDQTLLGHIAKTPEEAKVAFTHLDKILGKTASIVPFETKDGKVALSRSAMLISFAPELDKYRKEYAELEKKGATADQLSELTQKMEVAKAHWKDDNIKDMVGGGREGKPRDPDNLPVGTEYRVDVSPNPTKGYIVKPLTNPDKVHILGNILHAVYKHREIKPATEKDKGTTKHQLHDQGTRLPELLNAARNVGTLATNAALEKGDELFDAAVKNTEILANNVNAVGQQITQTARDGLQAASDLTQSGIDSVQAGVQQVKMVALDLGKTAQSELSQALSQFKSLVSNPFQASHGNSVRPKSASVAPPKTTNEHHH